MKTKSPYRDNKEFEKDLKDFANKFRVTIAEHSLELMINFMGIVHELKPECMRDEVAKVASDHIAPSLMISGTLGKPTKRIQESLEKRYYVNLFDNLFDDSSVGAFSSKSKVNKMATLGKKSEREPMYETTDSIMEELSDD